MTKTVRLTETDVQIERPIQRKTYREKRRAKGR